MIPLKTGLRWFPLGLLISSLLPCRADITLDGTMGPAGALAGPDFQIGAELGHQVGSNLFHSFGVFNINSSESATFSGPNSIDNILARVTGGSASTIDGLLRSTIPEANLFFLNPAGVVFGPNASLDVQGSFHVSTANYLKLADGTRFDTLPSSNDALLTTAPPEAFGFLGPNPAPISVEGSLLEVPEGETLSVMGGDIKIADGSLYAPGGRIDMVSVASPGEVLPNAADQGVASFARLGRIEISHSSSERPRVDPSLPPEVLGNEIGNVDASGEGGGRIFIRGGQFVMDNSNIKANTLGDRNGVGIDVNVDSLHMSNSAQIRADTFGAGTGGSLEVKAHSMLLEGGIKDFRLLEGPTGLSTTAEKGSTGDGGSITVDADRLTMRDGAQISASTSGAGRGGDLRITADTITLLGRTTALNLTAFYATARDESTGDGGDITVDADSLTMRDEAEIMASSSGAGRGGDLRITADTMLLEGVGVGLNLSRRGLGLFTSTESTGDAGDITVDVGSLMMLGQPVISTSTFGPGKAGDIRITADTMRLEGVGERVVFGPSLVADAGRADVFVDPPVHLGDAGDITVDVGSLEMQGIAEIRASAFGSGKAGDITITADTMLLEGIGGMSGPLGLFAGPLGLFADAGAGRQEGPGGDAGDITVDAGGLTMRGSAGISASTFGAGAGGNLSITADTMRLEGGGGEFGPRLSADVGLGGTGGMRVTSRSMQAA